MILEKIARRCAVFLLLAGIVSAPRPCAAGEPGGPPTGSNGGGTGSATPTWNQLGGEFCPVPFNPIPAIPPFPAACLESVVVSCPAGEQTPASQGGMSNGALELSNGQDVCIGSSGAIQELQCPAVKGATSQYEVVKGGPDTCGYSMPPTTPTCPPGYALEAASRVSDMEPAYQTLLGINLTPQDISNPSSLTCVAFALPSLFTPIPVPLFRNGVHLLKKTALPEQEIERIRGLLKKPE